MFDELTSLRAALSDRYVIDEEIGRGGMATVYLADDLKHARPVAIKVLHPEFSDSTTADRFLREIRIAASLRHPGILPVYDSGNADGLLYYVMPYVPGESLRERLEREKQLPMEEALRITSELAAALEEAHGRGIVHRDIKPENVLFEGEQPQLMDFGVARVAPEAEAEKLTRTGVSVGTPHYMSPEQVSGDDVDARSDVYALGCVLYEMLGGEPPYTGPSSQAIMARHAMAPVPDVRTLRPTVPEGVVAALERALAKVPADRYESAGALAAALSRGDEKLRRRDAKRISWRDITIAALVLLTAAGVYLTTRLGGDGASAPELRRVAVVPFDFAGEGITDTLLAEGLFVDVIQRLGGYEIAPLSWNVTRSYRDSDDPVRDLHELLRADIVWLTRLESREDSIWARAELVDAASMTSLGIATIGRAAEDLYSIVPDLVQWASAELGLGSPHGVSELDPEARREFVKGVAAWQRGANFTPVAMQHFEAATRIDPDYAEAWGYYAVMLVQMAHGGEGTWCERAARWIPSAREAARRALERDSTLVTPRVALGHALWEHEFDFEGARREFERAVELDPEQPDALMFLGWYMHTMGRPDSAAIMLDRAVAANPLDRAYHNWRVFFYRLVGRSAEIEDDLRQLRLRWPDSDWVVYDLAISLRNQGRLEEAVQVLAEAGRDTAEMFRDDVGWIIARGDTAALDRQIEAAVEEELYRWAALMAYWADRDEIAFGYLRRWYDAEQINEGCRSRGLVWLLADFPGFITRPEFQQMLDEVGLTWRESYWAREAGL
ncbi:MAG: protein kinase [marine benthic group bacterium]|nr:protein kinase [Gemmatimonadota bacterium]